MISNSYLLADYPFLRNLSKYLEEIHFDFEEIIKTKNQIYWKAIERIKKYAENEKIEYEEDPYEEISIFLVSLYFASQLGSIFIRKFADIESKRCSKKLNNEKFETIIYIARDFLSEKITIERIKKDFEEIQLISLPLTEYLKYASHFSGYKWSLAFKEIDKGKIFLDVKEIIRLIEEKYRQWLIIKCEELSTIVYPEVIEDLKDIKLEKQGFIKEVKYEGEDPPCMRILLQDLKEGKKLSHMERFALVTYLRVRGWNVEDIVNLFRTLPDFKEDITRYQIEHIFGLRGGRKVYSVPSCLTMKVANLCFPESPYCDNIKHPLQFKQKGKRKWRQK